MVDKRLREGEFNRKKEKKKKGITWLLIIVSLRVVLIVKEYVLLSKCHISIKYYKHG